MNEETTTHGAEIDPIAESNALSLNVSCQGSKSRGEPGAARQLVLQAMLVLLAWIYVVALHWGNDGLWYLGDSARHMANGLFWKDYLRSLDPDPAGFAAAFYARYPVINPISYPPVFYLLEAVAFSIFGASPFVAKGLVLAFALLASGYTMALLRRAVAPKAGYLGALTLLFPYSVVYSQAVMLNIPAMALVIAAMHHARRWLEAPESRQIYPTAAFSVLAVLCYIPSSTLVFVLIAWIIALRRWKTLTARRTWILAALAGFFLLPWAILVIRTAPGYTEMTTPSAAAVSGVGNWGYYVNGFRMIFGWPAAVLAVAGAVVGIASARWRREIVLSLIWVMVVYVSLTYLKAKDARYILPLAGPVACLDAIATLELSRAIRRVFSFSKAFESGLTVAAMLVLIAGQAGIAWFKVVPDIRGFQEVVDFFDREAPGEPIFYDGEHSGKFTVLAMATDKEFCRRIVRGDKVLYVNPMNRSIPAREFVASRPEMIDALRRRAGCQWIVIETGDIIHLSPAARLLRTTLAGPEFELVKTFKVSGLGIGSIQVFRALIPIERPDSIDLPMPMMGSGKHLQVPPIRRERIDGKPSPCP